MKTKKTLAQLLRTNSTVFTFKDIALIWEVTNLDTTKSQINYYVKKGELYPIRRGIYAKDKNYDRFELAVKIYPPAYISFETVLTQHGMVFQHYRQIFVASYLSREIVMDKQPYIFKKIKKQALTNTLGIQTEGNYAIASAERAFLDILYLNKNYHFDNLSSLDWDKCYEIVSLYNNQALIKRLNHYYKNA